MNIQWYPGHMTKAVRMMEENLKCIDLVIELLDARIPMSSRNPDIDRMAKGKFRLVVLNKSDLAEDTGNKAWLEYFERKGLPCVLYNSKSKNGVKELLNKVKDVCKDKIERDRRRGIINRSIKSMVVGIPNVGKSTFVNNIVGKNAAVVGNKPGVTKGKQWIHVSKELDLLDTPGILWPKFEDELIGIHIGFIGSVNDEILLKEELALHLIDELLTKDPGILKERFGEWEEGLDAPKILEHIAIVRKCIQKKEEPDLKKAADLLLEEFRSGKLGRITLEIPCEE